MGAQSVLSVRQKLARYVDGGRLRYDLQGKVDDDMLELLITVAGRYCSPRRIRHKKRAA